MSSRLPPSSSHSIKFGHAQSTSPSKSSTFGQERSDGVLDWLDYAECSLCRDPLLNGAGKGKCYWMTSCGHILCSSDEHQHREGICTACNKQMELFIIQEGSLPAGHEVWFQNGVSLLSGAMEEIRTAVKKNISALRVMGFQYREMKRSIQHYKSAMKEKDAQIATVQREQETLLSENHELHERVAELQSGLRNLQRSQPAVVPQITPQSQYSLNSNARQAELAHYNQQQPNTRKEYMPPPPALPTVQEEEKQPAVGFGYGMGKGDFEGSNKRRRIDILEQQPRRFVPPTPASGAFEGPIHLQHPKPSHNFQPTRPISRAFSSTAPRAIPRMEAPPQVPFQSPEGRLQNTMHFRHMRDERNADGGGDVKSRLDAYRYDPANPSPNRRAHRERPGTTLPNQHERTFSAQPLQTQPPQMSIPQRPQSSFIERLKMSNSSFMNRPGSARLTPLQHYTSAPSVDVSRSMVTGTGMGMVQGNAGVRTREDVLQGGVKMSLAHGVGQKNSGN
ncbi:hypothetical protein CNBG_4698 [Cryptococcus deuterogattii R265]|uniref:uncharacterized protein n=1 Tax=Cryptococcus deuterogattii (strain R265) TaxID=294750 RepID=UPI001938E493|nr:hypothetical protein CNBG_4698 [Cryptococcus deuterogattii R265]